jgi:RHS repeat-associated protein
MLAKHKQNTTTLPNATDQINSTRIVTDSAGTVVYSALFDPYGGIEKQWVNTYQPSLKFFGKERESKSEIDYFGARYYDHKRYRFISVDPVINKDEALVNPQLWNLYSYCRNNPVTFLDPDGRTEGSLSNLWIRLKVSLIAFGYDGSTDWAYNQIKDDFPKDRWKCNKFVYDVTKEAGALAEVKVGAKTFRLPRAGEWANPNVNIPNWRVLEAGENILPGDVAAYQLEGGTEFSGHSGIMIVNETGNLTNISAHESNVSTVPNQFGNSSGFVENNSTTIFRRYTGE